MFVSMGEFATGAPLIMFGSLKSSCRVTVVELVGVQCKIWCRSEVPLFLILTFRTEEHETMSS